MRREIFNMLVASFMEAMGLIGLSIAFLGINIINIVPQTFLFIVIGTTLVVFIIMFIFFSLIQR